VKENSHIIPDSSDLSSIPTESDSDPDLLDEGKLALPKNGNKISSTEWTPIATSGTNRSRKSKKRRAQREEEPTRYPDWTPDVSTYLNKPKKPKRKPRKRKNKGLYLSS
jgi:hypothetical protein